jgi:protein SCO1/2
MSVRRTSTFGILALVIASASLAGACRRNRPRAAEPTAALRPPPAIATIDIDEHLGQPLPLSLAFTDQDGRALRSNELFEDGRPVVMVLTYFRCPMLCDLVQQGLVASLRATALRPGEDFRVVTVSIDPADTRGNAGLRRTGFVQALGHGAPLPAAAWRVLIGGEPEVRALAGALGFRYVYDPTSRQYAHPACAFVLTPDGRISRYLYGTTFRPFDVRLAVVEAAQGKVGTIVDRVLLTCFRYDPAARKYGPYVVGIMRGGSTVVLAAFGLAMVVMIRRDRSRRRKGRDGA